MKKEQLQRRLIGTLLFLVLLIAVFPIPAQADTGPKPSVQITFANMDDRLCYGTLLSKEPSTGPASVWDGNEAHISHIGVDEEIWRAFVDYEDADGFYFLQWSWRCDETKELAWTYYPPQTFKVLLYYPETGEFLASGVCERYAFDSYFTMDVEAAHLSAEPAITARHSYNYTREIAGLIVRVILTVLVELGVAWLFGFRRKELVLLVVATNVVTQAAYNLAVHGAYNAAGPWAAVFWVFALEPVIFAVEAVAYCLLFNRFGEDQIRRRKTVLYALAANVCSFAAGFLLSKVIPFAF